MEPNLNHKQRKDSFQVSVIQAFEKKTLYRQPDKHIKDNWHYAVYSNCKQPTLFSHGNHGISRKNLKKKQKNIFENVFSLFYSNSVFFHGLPWRMNCGRLLFEQYKKLHVFVCFVFSRFLC